MLRDLKNECIIKFDLLTNGPLLIRDGKPSELDPTVPDIQFIKSIHNGKLEPIMPGSSIKGVFRSRMERLMYSIHGCVCCNVFDRDKKNPYKSCSTKYNDKKDTGKEKYKVSCPACKLFGNLGLKSRIQFKDAFMKDKNYKMGRRTNVGLDRITGASIQGALFEPEVLEEGIFECEMKIENYFRWQLKLIVHILEEINEGYVTFGGSTSRGFGNMKFDNFKISSKEYGIVGDEFYKKSEYDLEQLKNILKDTRIDEESIKNIELDGQAIKEVKLNE